MPKSDPAKLLLEDAEVALLRHPENLCNCSTHVAKMERHREAKALKLAVEALQQVKDRSIPGGVNYETVDSALAAMAKAKGLL